ncbi:hypothetical protein PGTUg99_027619 [Puccinia graminis f. sp. tritici]|uniref:Uncharacterized protein n=1 Tax=Puccinia graminis f. sp. tritici TaxID=56615 RepID=A0A5B0PIL9_PUCGR|nr:hypothetical protein PGTUg99_027619 [Puccinia graminis f. sp. tritici]
MAVCVQQRPTLWTVWVSATKRKLVFDTVWTNGPSETSRIHLLSSRLYKCILRGLHHAQEDLCNTEKLCDFI